MHKKSLAVVNIVNADSITKSGTNIVIHGFATTAPGTAANYTFAAADYLISIVAN